MSNESRIKTGYPHLDKPWLQFYDEKRVSIPEPETNVTEYLKMKNQGRGNLIASSYYGKETSFNELFNRADIAAKVLNELGVQKGEVIMNLVPNIPASGEIWPTAAPWVAPENRPSVRIATLSASPIPNIAPVNVSISRIPGPPRGPS